MVYYEENVCYIPYGEQRCSNVTPQDSVYQGNQIDNKIIHCKQNGCQVMRFWSMCLMVRNNNELELECDDSIRKFNGIQHKNTSEELEGTNYHDYCDNNYDNTYGDNYDNKKLLLIIQPVYWVQDDACHHN